MQPHGSRIVDPRAQLSQLRPGQYLRITVRLEAARKLTRLVAERCIRLDGQAHGRLNTAIKNGCWPSGETISMFRIEQGALFDAERLVEILWPHVTEAFTLSPSSKSAPKSRRTGFQKPGATNRSNRRTKG